MTDLYGRPTRRREFMQAGAGVALGAGALGALGCGVSKTGGGSEKDTEKVVKAKPDGDLVYFNYSEYIDPDVVKAFEKEYGVKVRESYYDSMPAMLSKLRAGNRYDVIFPTQEYVNRLVRGNQLIKLDKDQIKNADQINEFFANPAYDEGSAHTVPYTMYTTGICYRTDKIKDMTGSWTDLSNPEGKNRTYMLDDFQECIGQANYINGFELNTQDPDELEKSKQTLLEQKENLRAYSTNDIPNLSSGNAWIHHAWNGDVVNVRNQVKNPEDFKYQTNKEGVPVGSDTMAIPTNAQHPGTALLFIDWMLDPDNAAKNIAYIGYPMPNDGAAGAFAELVKDDPSIDVTTEDLEKGDQFIELTPAGRKAWDRVWTEVRAS